MKTAEQFEREGNTFDPQAHFTGDRRNLLELRFVNHLILKYSDSIVAYHYQSVHGPIGFSAELQFVDDDIAMRCVREYDAAFTPSGGLKQRLARIYSDPRNLMVDDNGKLLMPTVGGD